MAPHAKVFALYDKAFWREAGLSGARPSMQALVEIHDATTASGGRFVSGSCGVPRRATRASARRCSSPPLTEQLVLLFGPQAALPLARCSRTGPQTLCTATPSGSRIGAGRRRRPPSHGSAKRGVIALVWPARANRRVRAWLPRWVRWTRRTRRGRNHEQSSAS
jgi:monoamine oxidase